MSVCVCCKIENHTSHVRSLKLSCATQRARKTCKLFIYYPFVSQSIAILYRQVLEYIVQGACPTRGFGNR